MLSRSKVGLPRNALDISDLSRLRLWLLYQHQVPTGHSKARKSLPYAQNKHCMPGSITPSYNA